MKITNAKLVEFVNVLNAHENDKLPQKIAYAILKNSIIMGREYKVYIQQVQAVLDQYKPYTIKDENGNIVLEKGLPKVDDEHREAFYADLAEILNFEIEVDNYKIPESAFDYDDMGKYDVLSPTDIFKLQRIMCETA